jgi:ADP-heptose:LPS heptosyltransferase
MNVSTMRKIDWRLGVPGCLCLTLWRRLADLVGRRRLGPTGKILLVKLAEQGSTVLAAPAIRRAVALVGRQNVYFLCFEENRFILDVMGLVPPENVLTIRTGGLPAVLAGAWSAIRRARRIGIDSAVDLEFFARSSAALCYLSGARRRVGLHSFGGEAAYRGDLMTHRLSFNPHMHTSQFFQVMVEALQAKVEDLPALPLPIPPLAEVAEKFLPLPEDLQAVRQMLKLPGDAAGGATCRLIVLNPNCSDLLPQRAWAPQRYVELARGLLAQDAHCRIVFTSGPSEAAPTAALAQQVGSDRVICLAGRTTLRQVLTLYCLADVLVTNDSGPAHFASLTPVDVVVLFGPETPKLFAAVSPRSHVLYAGIACSPCVSAYNDRLVPCDNNLCLQAITVEGVLQAVGEVLRQRAARQAGPAPERASTR